MDMKTKNFKILFFATEDWFICSHWLPIIDGAKRMGLDVVVVTRVHKHLEMIQQYGVKVIPFEISRRGTGFLSEIDTVLQLIKVYRKEKPDIAHHIALKPMLYGSLAAYLTHVKHTINWVAGMGWLFISNSWRAKIMQAVVKKVLSILLRGTDVIVENKDDQAIIANLGASTSRLHLIRGAGVDTSLYLQMPETADTPLVILPARMLWDKGVGEFVDAAIMLKKRGVVARFVLVGEPDHENPASVSNNQLEKWQNDGVVEWWGRREDMPSVLAQAHIVCLPSYREGLPKSLLEAASCGRPIVTTDVPGCREVVLDGHNGILVQVRNPSALADALAKLLAEPELRLQMGLRGRERVMREFSQEIIVKRVLAIYRKVLS
jgi:glycosyltransferase involved in cell wall biosynthesis